MNLCLRGINSRSILGARILNSLVDLLAGVFILLRIIPADPLEVLDVGVHVVAHNVVQTVIVLWSDGLDHRLEVEVRLKRGDVGEDEPNGHR